MGSLEKTLPHTHTPRLIKGVWVSNKPPGHGPGRGIIFEHRVGHFRTPGGAILRHPWGGEGGWGGGHCVLGVGVGWGSCVRLLLRDRATASWNWGKGVIAIADCVTVELRIGAGGGGGWGSFVRLFLRARATAPWGWGKGATRSRVPSYLGFLS